LTFSKKVINFNAQTILKELHMSKIKRRDFLKTGFIPDDVLTFKRAYEHGLGEIDPGKLKLLEL